MRNGTAVTGTITPDYTGGVFPEWEVKKIHMMATKRTAQKPLPPMPLSELPMMKSLLAMATPLVGDKTTRDPTIKGDPKTQLTMLRLTIIDKLQVPRAETPARADHRRAAPRQAPRPTAGSPSTKQILALWRVEAWVMFDALSFLQQLGSCD